MDSSKTSNTVDIQRVVTQFFQQRSIPAVHQSFWRGINYRLVDNYMYPAAKTDKNELTINPKWANVGVLAHEFAHISHEVMRTSKIWEFNDTLKALFVTDQGYLRLLASTNSYMRTNNLEAHAEIYRYLGEKMPEQLKQFYPKLM